jgi:hypothetical protein
VLGFLVEFDPTLRECSDDDTIHGDMPFRIKVLIEFRKF